MHAYVSLVLLLLSATPPAAEPSQPTPKKALKMNQKQASLFARQALAAIQREYPNKPDHVLNGESDIKGPRALHPAFYGSFDWHSSVHGHWMLVRLLRCLPDLPERKEIHAVLREHLTAKNLQTEADYFAQPNRKLFERTYGWAWLLKLAEELHEWDDPDGRQWSQNIRPLADAIVARALDFLPKQTYPIRTGVHPNTAFGLCFMLDYARAVGNEPFAKLIEQRSRFYFGHDAAIPAQWEPGGTDFLSPEPDRGRPDAPRHAAGRVSPLAAPLPAGPYPRRAEVAVDAGHGDRPERSAACASGRAESEPRVVHAEHRRGAARRMTPPARCWPIRPLCMRQRPCATSTAATTWASTGWPHSPSICCPCRNYCSRHTPCAVRAFPGQRHTECACYIDSRETIGPRRCSII